ncbi:MAG: right-handed parallel beta-helix repeat-containing protein [Anaerolineae bacterium]|nr:right-handed parallel beta-helix repeat-containing protein [Anaerolineae bacterium]
MHKQYKSTTIPRPKRPPLVALLALALALVGLLAPPVPLHAAGTIIYVNAGASGSGDGSSWADAYPSLADALAGAASDTEIWVASGTYKPTTTASDPRTATFQLKAGVEIYGGFAGNETQRDQRDWQTNVTLLSGDLNGDDSGALSLSNPTLVDNSYSVVTGATGATLDGVTITSGYAIKSGFTKFGGGMYNDNSSPTLANVTFSGNAANYGGGMFNTNGSNPTLTNVTFTGNASIGFDCCGGGGMANINSSPTLTSVTFSGNTSSRFGGGMYGASASPVLMHVTFDGNSAVFEGGGLYSTGPTNLTLTDATFSGNSATYGGGIFHGGGSPTLTNVIFSGNSATNGGGMATFSGSPTLTNVIFSGNSATYGGGMFTLTDNNATLTNVIFSGNSATDGGGLLTTGSNNLTLTNATISGNAALRYGGGMLSQNGSNPQIRNSILWNNGSSGVYIGNDLGQPASVPVFSASIVQGSGGSTAWNPTFGDAGYYYNVSTATDGGGNLDVDPLFVGSSDLHLGSGSPAINAGDNSFLPVGVTTDLDGNPRIVGGTVDMGAYESQEIPLANPTLTTTATDASGASTLVSDSATISEGSNPTGSITFKLYGPSPTPDCTNLVFTSSPVTVNGNGAYGPVSFSPTAVGAYYWVASYSGDAHNSPVSGTCGDAGETSTVNPGAAQVIKTVNGATPGSTQLFTFQLREGASASQEGTTLEPVEANSANNWTINFTTPLVPGQHYQLCEWVPPGWNTNLGPNPFVPNSDANNGMVCTDFGAEAGQTITLNVDNTPPPGGRALGIGFWKNWASCGKSNGNQQPVLDQTLALATGMTTNPPGGLVVSAQDVGGGWPNFAPTYALVLKGNPAAPDAAPDCSPAVNLLNKMTIDGKTKKANDPLFNMAAQLVGAQLNYFAGADPNGTTTSNIQRGVLLLGQYGFNGLNYSPKLSSADASTATCLAEQLDNYNNNRSVDTCP